MSHNDTTSLEYKTKLITPNMIMTHYNWDVFLNLEGMSPGMYNNFSGNCVSTIVMLAKRTCKRIGILSCYLILSTVLHSRLYTLHTNTECRLFFIYISGHILNELYALSFKY